MATNRETFGLSGIAAQMPNAGALLEAQRTAAENAARMAGATCHYAMSWNRAWLNFWSNHLSQYTELPRRFADAQTSFMEQAFDHYQESIQQLGTLASQIQDETEEATRETQEAAQKAVEGLHAETKNMTQTTGKASRSKGNRAEEQRSQPQRGGEPQRGSEHHQRGGAH